MAIKAELTQPIGQTQTKLFDPPTQSGGRRGSYSLTHGDDEELPERLKRFLLMPTADGREPRRLGEFSAFFMAILTVPPADRQSMMISLCEMIALVSGLLLTVPVGLRRQHTAQEHSWRTLPASRDDAMDALAFLTFFCLATSLVFAVSLALFIAVGGSRATIRFYESAIPIVGTAHILMLFGGLFPLIFLLFWQFFIAASSPYPMLGALVALLVVDTVVHTLFVKFMIREFPLEHYHVPRWFICFARSQVPHLASLFSDKQLEAAAKARAAELRVRCGIEVAGVAGLEV